MRRTEARDDLWIGNVVADDEGRERVFDDKLESQVDAPIN
jgi:hypothetical protein